MTNDKACLQLNWVEFVYREDTEDGKKVKRNDKQFKSSLDC